MVYKKTQNDGGLVPPEATVGGGERPNQSHATTMPSIDPEPLRPPGNFEGSLPGPTESGRKSAQDEATKPTMDSGPTTPPDNFEGTLPGPTKSGRKSGPGGGTSLNSHLDSLFESSGWNRDDVLLVASIIQTLAILYLVWGDG